ncbi:MAG TPA: Isoquinoline 1-oxidoreductase subunit [Burkholderiaceae bacterium]
MQGSIRVTAVVLTAMVAGFASAVAFAQTAELRTPQSFDTIADKAERSRAQFVEAGKVIQSPRCLNCHPNGDRPTQGNDMHLHQPMVVRGPADKGATALRCMTCHQATNFAPAGVPGHPLWHLAPLSMAWQGQSLGQICEQLKDRRRNGGKSLAQIHEHMAKDTLVGWAWTPGADRTPAPGTQEAFGRLVEAWIANGAACPPK